VATKPSAKEVHGGLEYFAVVLALAISGACSEVGRINPGGPAPGNPAPPAGPVSPVGSRVVRGVVLEDLPVFPDVRPAAGVPVRVFSGGRVVEATSGADGSFETDVPETAPFVRVVAAGPWYFTPCPAFRRAEDALFDEPLEVMVVSGAVLSAIGERHTGAADRLVFGWVFEQTSAGRPAHIGSNRHTVRKRTARESPGRHGQRPEGTLYVMHAYTGA